MFDYQVYDFEYRDYACFKTLEEAKAYIERNIYEPEQKSNFALYKRERLE